MGKKRRGGRQAQGQMVLFSYGGKSVQKKTEETELRNRGRPEIDKREYKRENNPVSGKVIDYATLQAWYNDDGRGDSMVAERDLGPGYAGKQQRLKFIML